MISTRTETIATEGGSFAGHFSQPRIAVRASTETLAFLFAHLGQPGAGGA
jgi:hypothetical protein